MLFQLYSDLSQEQKSKALELLPVSVRHFSDIIGLKAALDLSDGFGGEEVGFPLVFSAEQELCAELLETIGENAARVLFDNYKGEIIYIPRCDKFFRAVRNLSLVRQFDELTTKMSGRLATKKLARRFHISYRSIEKIVSSAMVIPMVDNFPEKV